MNPALSKLPCFFYQILINADDKIKIRSDADCGKISTMWQRMFSTYLLCVCIIYVLRRGPGTSDFRRDVYRRDLWVQPLSDVTGRSAQLVLISRIMGVYIGANALLDI